MSTRCQEGCQLVVGDATCLRLKSEFAKDAVRMQMSPVWFEGPRSSQQRLNANTIRHLKLISHRNERDREL